MIQHQLQIVGPTGERTVDLAAETAVAGRQAGVDLLLEDKLVSRRHAAFTCTETDCTLTDLESSNGVKVNDARLTPNQPYPLDDGDIIEIGPFKLTYTRRLIAAEPLEMAGPEPAEIPATPEEPAEKPATPEPEPAVSAPPEMEAEPKPSPDSPPDSPPPAPAEIPAPPEEPPPPVSRESDASPPYTPPPGLALDRSEYLKYLPDIYHTDFMARFLAMFESIAVPARWNIDNFDMYLHPQTAPAGFLPWLAGWFELTLDQSWRDDQRRTLLTEAHDIYARRGTKKALSRILEIYTGQTPTIDDADDALEPFTFTVQIPLKKSEVNTALVEALINHHKPAYTNYKLKWR